MSCCTTCGALTEAGAPGPQGLDGVSAFSTLSAAFIQPAVGATVSITVSDTTWMADGANLYVGIGGYYEISSITDSTHVVIENLAIADNATAGTTIPSGGNVIPAGPGTPLVADQITNAYLDNMAANTIKCNPTAASANPQDLAIAANTIPGRSSSGNIAAKSVTDFGFSILDDANGAAVQTTLGITAFAQTILDDADAATARATLGLGNINTSNYQIFTTTGNFTKASLPSYTTHVIVEAWGAGGGGGGGNNVTNWRGVGGAGGGYSRKRIAVAALAASETVTIGAGGPGGAAGNPPVAGTSGGNTSFGAHCQANGGTGGAAATGAALGGVAGGGASGGDLNITGSTSSTMATGPGTSEVSFGGSAPFLGGEQRNVGGSGYNPGCGGSCGNHTGGSGGNGADGMVIVYW